MFQKFVLDYKENIFQEASNCVFEDIRVGRKSAILASSEPQFEPSSFDCVLETSFDTTFPKSCGCVRSTTQHNNPVQDFLPIHLKIIQDIISAVGVDRGVEFNNAQIEIYDPSYRTMRYHSDISLDLKKDSFICIFSCYTEGGRSGRNGTRGTGVRKLLTMEKKTGKKNCISLEHNSIVLFSTETNKKYKHKIVLDTNSTSKWLGITFRLSKTFLKYSDKGVLVDKKFTLATPEEMMEFYKLKKLENENEDYEYPEINYIF